MVSGRAQDASRHFAMTRAGATGTAKAVPVFEGKKKRSVTELNLATKTLEWPGDESNAAHIYLHLRFIVAAGRRVTVYNPNHIVGIDIGGGSWEGTQLFEE